MGYQHSKHLLAAICMVHQSNFQVDHNRPLKSCFLELKEILPGRLESNRHIVLIAKGYHPVWRTFQLLFYGMEEEMLATIPFHRPQILFEPETLCTFTYQ